MYLSENPKCVGMERKQFSIGNKVPNNHGKPENPSSKQWEHRMMNLFSLVPDEPLYNYGDNSDVSNENVVARQIETSAFANNGENILPTNVVLDNKADNKFATDTRLDAGSPFLKRIQQCQNSPSASARVRALQALRFPENGNLYHFDVPYHEVDIITAEERQPKTQSIQDVMKGVVVYVEIRSSEDDRSSGVKEVISKLGAKVNDRLLRNTTHVIFKDGLMSTYKKAKNWNIPIVSLHWIEACKKHLCLMDPSEFNIQDFHRYENPELYDKAKRVKFRQPGAEEKLKSFKDSSTNKSLPITPIQSPKRTTKSTNGSNQKSTATPLINWLQKRNIANITDSVVNANASKSAAADNASSTITGFTENQAEGTPTPLEHANNGEETILKSQLMEISVIDDAVKSSAIDVHIKKLRRQTVCEPQQIDETLKKTSILNKRRTMVFSTNANISESAITPIRGECLNSRYTSGKFTASTPVNGSLLKKTLLSEYETTFSATKTPGINGRRSILNISMDIINQRVENINKLAKLNNSKTEIDSTMDISLDNIKKIGAHVMESPVNLSPSTSQTAPPRRRKLFDPNSNSSFRSDVKRITVSSNDNMMSTPNSRAVTNSNVQQQNTKIVKETTVIDVNTETETLAKNSETMVIFKRGRDEDDIVKQNAKRLKKNSNDDPTMPKIEIKKPYNTRRSSMHFQPNYKPRTISSPAVKVVPSEQVLVFTNMHQAQITTIKEAVATLGTFKIEDKVSSRTTHLVSLEPRRTINLMKGLIRGIWILEYNWIVESMKHRHWQDEELFEMKSFSKAVAICRMERQLFGKKYRMNIFSESGSIFLSKDQKSRDLKDIIELSGGAITKNRDDATLIIGEFVPNENNKKSLLPNWILDSITQAQLQPMQLYFIRK